MQNKVHLFKKKRTISSDVRTCIWLNGQLEYFCNILGVLIFSISILIYLYLLQRVLKMYLLVMINLECIRILIQKNRCGINANDTTIDTSSSEVNVRIYM